VAVNSHNAINAAIARQYTMPISGAYVPRLAVILGRAHAPVPLQARKPKIAGRMSASTFEHTKRRFFMSEVLGWGCKKLREKRAKGLPGQE
jgi:hypothetical protein